MRSRQDYEIEVGLKFKDKVSEEEILAEADRFCEFMNNSGEGEDWEVNIYTESGYFELYGTGWEEGDYDPGCMYTSNGDGWPSSFDVDDSNFVEDNIIQEAKKYAEEHNLEFVRVNLM